jgi:hypothetical protein
MRYRALSPTGDYQFGKPGLFLVNSSEAVAQAVRTRLALWTGTWFLDPNEGTDYMGSVVGTHTQGTRDLIMKDRIAGTTGVSELLAYSSSVTNRQFSVSATVATIYGVTSINT